MNEEVYTYHIEPTNAFRFFNEETEVLRLDKEGFHYKGETINDAGEAYELFIEWMKNSQSQNNEV